MKEKNTNGNRIKRRTAIFGIAGLTAALFAFVSNPFKIFRPGSFSKSTTVKVKPNPDAVRRENV